MNYSIKREQSKLTCSAERENDCLLGKERIAFVDYIRVVACLLVMVVHASEQFYNMGPISQVANEDNRLWVSVYDGFFGRISVPLFTTASNQTRINTNIIQFI